MAGISKQISINEQSGSKDVFNKSRVQFEKVKKSILLSIFVCSNVQRRGPCAGHI